MTIAMKVAWSQYKCSWSQFFPEEEEPAGPGERKDGQDMKPQRRNTLDALHGSGHGGQPEGSMGASDP